MTGIVTFIIIQPTCHPEFISGSIFMFRGALKEHECLFKVQTYFLMNLYLLFIRIRLHTIKNSSNFLLGMFTPEGGYGDENSKNSIAFEA